MAKVDEYLNCKSKIERDYMEKELKKMLFILFYIIDADRNIDSRIMKSTSKFNNIVPIAYECFEELGWPA